MNAQKQELRILNFDSSITELTIGDLAGLLGSMATAILGQLKPECLKPTPTGKLADSELLEKAAYQIAEALRGREAKPEEHPAGATKVSDNAALDQVGIAYMKLCGR